jgi:predicted transcriptional regulator
MKIDTKQIIDTWVPRLRKLKIRQYQFATMSGVHASQFSQYVSDRIKPTTASFEKIENKIRELEDGIH